MENFSSKYFKIKLLLILVIATVLFKGQTATALNSQQHLDITSKKLARLETSVHGRLGLYAINTGNNQVIAYRANEPFPFCSTFKLMGVAAILKMSEKQPSLMQKKINYHQADVVSWSPVSKNHLDSGMTIHDLSKAAITDSDTTAINLLVKQLGGLEAVNQFARTIGDHHFRLDRWEPDLNTAIPGDIRDTTTPKAMANSLRNLVLGSALAAKPRALLKSWLIACTTGTHRIRAATPKDWIVGDKTGSGDYGTGNDVGIIWPKQGAPIVVAIYFTQGADSKMPSKVIAAATQIVLADFKNTGRNHFN